MTKTPDAKKRRPRDRRVPERERPRMALTDRDIEIIKAVNDCRALLTRQIETLFGMSRSKAQSRLSRLYHNEYLERRFLSVVKGGPASSPIVYTVGKRGADVLIRHYNLAPSAIYSAPKDLSWEFLEHLLEINHIRIAVTNACRINGFTLELWLDEYSFRAAPEYVSIRNTKGRYQDKPVYPDAYFRLRVPQGQAHFFLEHDRGTEPRSKFKPQIEVYEAYTRSGQYEARFHTKSLRILVVTTSTQRLHNLREVTIQAGGDRKYWFTTFDQITAQSILTQAIWERVGTKELVPLIG
jgi:hypothetical protein